MNDRKMELVQDARRHLHTVQSRLGDLAPSGGLGTAEIEPTLQVISDVLQELETTIRSESDRE